MINHNCRSSPSCNGNFCWAKLVPSKDKNMDRCNRCLLPQHQKYVNVCNQRPTTALNTGNCLKGNSCCKAYCKSTDRPWTSPCHRLKKPNDQYYRNAKVICVENQLPDEHNPQTNDVHKKKLLPKKCFHNSTFSELNCPFVTDDNRTLLSSTPTSQGTFVISSRNHRRKKKKKKCHSNRKTQLDSLKTKDSIYNCQTKKSLLETELENNCTQISEPTFKGSMNEDNQFKQTLKDIHFPSKIEARRKQNCKANKIPCTKPSTPSTSSLSSTPTMPRIEERKCCSFNDLEDFIELQNKRFEQEFTIPPCREQLKSAKLSCKKSLIMNCYSDSTKLSNYFGQSLQRPHSKTSCDDKIEILKLTNNGDNPNIKPNIKPKITNTNEKPFQIFNLNKSVNVKNTTTGITLPVHPVARPNLAAILRIKHSQQKLKEFEKNCTYDLQKQSSLNWEVRKSDAWKALLLSDSHKDILAIRLATRQAEQALQRREYELNMELMRQRVKSSPLLLEGGLSAPGSSLASRHRIKHNCSSEEMANFSRRQSRIKNCVPRSISCSLNETNFTTVTPSSNDIPQKVVESKPKSKDEQTQTQISAENAEKTDNQRKKFQIIYRIYNGYGCDEPNKLKLPRSSKKNSCKYNHERPLTPIVDCRHIKSSKFHANNCRKKPVKHFCIRQKFPIENDSGDELCSLDRALL